MEKENKSIAPMGAAVPATYEENSWTPVLKGSLSNGNISYTIQTGRYVKINNQVTVHAQLSGTYNTLPRGEVLIAGLPYVNQTFCARGIIEIHNAKKVLDLYVKPGETIIRPFTVPFPNHTELTFESGDISNQRFDINLQITYLVA